MSHHPDCLHFFYLTNTQTLPHQTSELYHTEKLSELHNEKGLRSDVFGHEHVIIRPPCPLQQQKTCVYKLALRPKHYVSVSVVKRRVGPLLLAISNGGQCY